MLPTFFYSLKKMDNVPIWLTKCVPFSCGLQFSYLLKYYSEYSTKIDYLHTKKAENKEYT